jgi:hypothetical protein
VIVIGLLAGAAVTGAVALFTEAGNALRRRSRLTGHPYAVSHVAHMDVTSVALLDVAQDTGTRRR